MRFLFTAALSSGLLFAGAVAHADTITTFNFQGASIFYGMAGDTNTVNGSATIDTTTGQVQTISFVAAGQSFSGVTAQNGAEVFVGPSSAAFSFSEASLIGYSGSTFNLNAANDLFVGSSLLATQINGTSLTDPALLTATTITPEPTTLLLAMTGLPGLGVLLRRRMLGFTVVPVA